MLFNPINKTKKPNEAWEIILAKSNLFFFIALVKSIREDKIKNIALIRIRFDNTL